MLDEEDLEPGHKLGPYELVLPVAQGGMATVWAARFKGARGFSREVAIKAMRPSLGDDPQFAEMFHAEAKLACRVRHPNVCDVMELGEQDGTLYIVMEWVDGEPLAAIQRAAAKKGSFPLALAARIGAAAAHGLHAAHEVTDDSGRHVGLVHRDVSPANILVTYSGQVKIVDFGVAKAAANASEGPQTRVGETKGTLTFMSPEQAVGGRVDRRSDVFSLGTVLYYLLGGKHPFKADNPFQTLGLITNRAPVAPLVTLRPDCPPSLNDAIMKALEKAPDNRFATMAQMAAALERAGAEIEATEPAPDTAAFVREMVGDRGERRAASIREATALLEGHQPVPKAALPPRASLISQSDPRGSFASVAPPPGPPRPPMSTPTSDLNDLDTMSLRPGGKRLRMVLIAGGVLLLVALAAFAATR